MNRTQIALLLVILMSFSCKEKNIAKSNTKTSTIQINPNETAIIILGTIQDAGSPQIGCQKDCCKTLFNNPDKNRQVVSLGLIDNEFEKKYMFEASPDFVTQTKALVNPKIKNTNEIPDGIFLTHAHIGHYTGLMYLGKEAMNASKVPVYAMPKMKTFLESNGPWSQLVKTENIILKDIQDGQTITLTNNLNVTPFLVPHRDEYSETVGYKIKGKNKSALFIPDIDKWSKWEKSIIEEIKTVDYAFVDATFFSGKELNNRDMSQIPHPFILESLDLFKNLPLSEKNKIVFIHFNHTNPVINLNSKEAQTVIKAGFNIAQIHDIYKL
ncbi:pyrroloquinoline quinone biosynthesis protein PqqB [Tamlana sedimentorum]|uniref:Pyrroloquinoline quinone biosynthesis protein PqqB n=1 Tax=Neotamlana sedimentorum TaxID=1435349 RepID=A0A0D7W163_9FLAO|nr:MBL fold metallo-hydrolase [Tamlana sedimentorum]KJD32769.1 pyrroloquinoline quinone biosynthesis protein PqqB [Tamlana sedimentorum]